MSIFSSLFGRQQTPEQKIAHAMSIIQDIGARLASKYPEKDILRGNILKYLAIFAAGEFMREAMESGQYESFSDSYEGTPQQALLRGHLNRAIENLVRNGLASDIADSRLRPRIAYYESAALDTVIWFVSTNRTANPHPPAFFTALRMFYDLAEERMRKGFRWQD